MDSSSIKTCQSIEVSSAQQVQGPHYYRAVFLTIQSSVQQRKSIKQRNDQNRPDKCGHPQNETRKATRKK